ncbi:MAG: cytochrome c3 family protein [Planctomycetes bacterium]|nr:cytochrome c3 family protein [Planctomycetota bacterium]
MKYYFSTLLLAAVAVAGTGCEQVKSTQKEQKNPERPADRQIASTPETVTDDEPLLLLDDEPLLLLDDEPDEDSSTESMADNSRCFVCHINYMDEDIAVTHARVNIGCADCHGESDEHIADESWAWGGNGTPPDIMYPRAKINPFCMGCHPKDKIDTEQHKPLFAGTIKEKYCTDCHGNHRLVNRKCKWK